jgi:hypothetical protein
MLKINAQDYESLNKFVKRFLVVREKQVLLLPTYQQEEDVLSHYLKRMLSQIDSSKGSSSGCHQLSYNLSVLMYKILLRIFNWKPCPDHTSSYGLCPMSCVYCTTSNYRNNTNKTQPRRNINHRCFCVSKCQHGCSPTLDFLQICLENKTQNVKKCNMDDRYKIHYWLSVMELVASQCSNKKDFDHGLEHIYKVLPILCRLIAS